MGFRIKKIKSVFDDIKQVRNYFAHFEKKDYLSKDNAVVKIASNTNRASVHICEIGIYSVRDASLLTSIYFSHAIFLETLVTLAKELRVRVGQGVGSGRG